MVVPLGVAVVAIPWLIDLAGKERFGLLTLVWMGVGYFSLFDMGLGRALTQIVAESGSADSRASLGVTLWTAFGLLFLLGVLGIAIVVGLAPSMVDGLLHVPSELRAEALRSFCLLGAGLPIVTLTSGLVGLLEGHLRFAAVNGVRLPLGLASFLGPLLTFSFSPSLVWATAALLLARFVALVIYYRMARIACPELAEPRSFSRQEALRLLRFGGWLTISNVIGPLMTYLDRFFVGAWFGLAPVAYYVTPYETLSRLLVLPQAVMNVLYPALAKIHKEAESRLTALYAAGCRFVFWVMLPIMAAIALLAPEGLQFWLGEEFRQAATGVVRWLALGWFVNALARPAFTLLQAAGRPDLVAKSHLAELLPYFAALFGLASAFGIEGVAMAWTLRVVLDTLLLNTLAARLRPEIGQAVRKTSTAAILACVAFPAAASLHSPVQRLGVLGALLCLSAWRLAPFARNALQEGLHLWKRST
jgi:O-antigen/teichoic acid export membrane protein